MSRIVDFIKKYLIPHDKHINVIDINDVSSNSGVEQPKDTFSWIGGGAFCERVKWIPDDPSCEVNNNKWIGEESTSFCELEIVTWEGVNLICQQ